MVRVIPLFSLVAAVTASAKTLVDIAGDVCTQTTLGSDYASESNIDPLLQDGIIQKHYVDTLRKLGLPSKEEGTCASHGYTVSQEHKDVTIPELGGKVSIDIFSKPKDDVGSSTVYSISDGVCIQGTFDQEHADIMKTDLMEAIELPVKEGTCSSQGYTVSEDQLVLDIPDGRTVSVDVFSEPQEEFSGALTTPLTELYIEMFGICTQIGVSDTFAPVLQGLSNGMLSEGTCVPHGYTVTDGHVALPKLEWGVYSMPGVTSARTDLYAVQFGFCTQLGVPQMIAPMLLSVSYGVLQEGTCDSHGYTVSDYHLDIPAPMVGNVEFDVFAMPGMLTTTTTDLYVVEFGFCTQIGVREMIAPLILGLSQGLLKEGTCGSHGYTASDYHVNIPKLPYIGEVVVDVLTKPGVSTTTPVDLYVEEFGFCTQIGVRELIAPMILGLSEGMVKKGTCESHGYTVHDGHVATESDEKIPFIGDLALDVFTVPGTATTMGAMHADQLGFCQQIDMRELFTPVLQVLYADVWKAGTCESQGYTVTVAHFEKPDPLFGDFEYGLYSRAG